MIDTIASRQVAQDVRRYISLLDPQTPLTPQRCTMRSPDADWIHYTQGAIPTASVVIRFCIVDMPSHTDRSDHQHTQPPSRQLAKGACASSCSAHGTHKKHTLVLTVARATAGGCCGRDATSRRHLAHLGRHDSTYRHISALLQHRAVARWLGSTDLIDVAVATAVGLAPAVTQPWRPASIASPVPEREREQPWPRSHDRGLASNAATAAAAKDATSNRSSTVAAAATAAATAQVPVRRRRLWRHTPWLVAVAGCGGWLRWLAAVAGCGGWLRWLAAVAGCGGWRRATGCRHRGRTHALSPGESVGSLKGFGMMS